MIQLGALSTYVLYIDVWRLECISTVSGKAMMDDSGNYHSVHQKTSRVYPRSINRHPICRILAAALDIVYAL